MMETWLPRKLRLLRVRQGLTLVEASKRTGVTRVTLSELERGHREPVAPTLVKIAEGYGVPVEELLEEPAPTGKAEASPSPEPGLALEEADEKRRAYPYSWMADTLAETLAYWHEVSLRPTDTPMYSYAITMGCLDTIRSVLKYDVPGETLKDRVPEEEVEERSRTADWLFKIAQRAQEHYINSKEAAPDEVRVIEERRAEIRRLTEKIA